MLTANQIREKYLNFFKSKSHAIIPSAPIVPISDPTTLFTGSGMQPLIPYLLGQPHPAGKRLANSQKSFRAEDIGEVGDNRHTTFFEMLGNWSLGDYFKEAQLSWFWEFLTQEIGLDPGKLYVSVFIGDPENNIPADEESVAIWEKLYKEKGVEAKTVRLGHVEKASQLGMQTGRIFYYDIHKNWWSRSGVPGAMPAGEPGGPDSEVFYDFGTPHDPKFGQECHPNCDCGRFLEIGNSVFMQYQKQTDGSLKELSQKNVDFGGGLERLTAAANHDPDIFKTDLFWPIIEKIKNLTNQKYQDHAPQMRVIADHLKAAVFMVAEGLQPSNKQQGYVLRRLLRRASVKFRQLTGRTPTGQDFIEISSQIVSIYPNYLNYPDLSPISTEMDKFAKTLDRGFKEFEKYDLNQLNALNAFNLYQTYGFPYEVTEELYQQKGVKLDIEELNHIYEAHQELSRKASSGMFRGGLADQSETVVKYHTATHLLQQALRDVLGNHVHQAGSNITGNRLRFDFTHTQPLTADELNQVENIINQKIQEDLTVTSKVMPYEEAIKSGALAFFQEKYPENVTVYQIGDYSKELCGGPHVTHTGEIGNIKVVKQESLGTSLRRIYLNALK